MGARVIFIDAAALEAVDKAKLVEEDLIGHCVFPLRLAAAAGKPRRDQANSGADSREN
jgi:hypothetical protein